VVDAAEPVFIRNQSKDNKFRGGPSLPLLERNPDTDRTLSTVVRENGPDSGFSYYTKGNGISERKCVWGYYGHPVFYPDVDRRSLPEILDFDLRGRYAAYAVVFQLANFNHSNPRAFAAHKCVSRYLIRFFANGDLLLCSADRALRLLQSSVQPGQLKSSNDYVDSGCTGDYKTEKQFGSISWLKLPKPSEHQRIAILLFGIMVISSMAAFDAFVKPTR
jgi:hypothetical protein